MNGVRIRQAMCWRPVVLNPQCVSESSTGCVNIRVPGLHAGDSDWVGLVWGGRSCISSKFPDAPGLGNHLLRSTAVHRSACPTHKHLFGGNTGKSDHPGKFTQEVLKMNMLLTLFSLLMILHLSRTINFLGLFVFFPFPRWLLGLEWIIVKKENNAFVPRDYYGWTWISFPKRQFSWSLLQQIYF